MSHRIQRIERLLQAELSDLIRRELEDPRLSLVSIGELQVSRDLSVAKIPVSVLGPDEHRGEAIQALQGAAGYLRRQLGRRLRLRTIPELRFHLDRGAEHSQRITELLDELGASGSADEVDSDE